MEKIRPMLYGAADRAQNLEARDASGIIRASKRRQLAEAVAPRKGVSPK